MKVLQFVDYNPNEVKKEKNFEKKDGEILIFKTYKHQLVD
jgi:hypothetical protein